MNSKKAIVCDLDGTLTESKGALTSAMSDVLCRVLSGHYLVVVSGGAFPQFQKQFLSHLNCDSEKLENLYLFPTMGSVCYVFDKEKNDWKKIYEENLTDDEREKIKNAFNETMKESGMDWSETYGELIEDRGTQVTLSGRGQNAPIEVKKVWDPNQDKRRILVSILRKKIPEFEITIGGATSIDVTRKGIDKAYAISKIKEIMKISDEDIIFVGDALYNGGNDSAVKKTGVDYVQESGPEETIEFLETFIV